MWNIRIVEWLRLYSIHVLADTSAPHSEVFNFNPHQYLFYPLSLIQVLRTLGQFHLRERVSGFVLYEARHIPSLLYVLALNSLLRSCVVVRIVTSQ